jgi:uncharacterized protein YneF (UPF0154 family)
MSDSNWGDRFKSFMTGDEVGKSGPISYWNLARSFSSLTMNLLLLLLLANMAIGVWSFYQDAEQRYRANKQNTESETQQAYDKIAKRCSVSSPSEHFVRSCISDAIKSYEVQKNTDQDLQAQQDMAFWALCMFIATVGSLIISVGGLAMLFLSLRQTRTAIRDNREIGEKQTRAFLAIDPVFEEKDIIRDLSKTISITVNVRNVGESPARNVKHIAFAGQIELPLSMPCHDLLSPDEGDGNYSIVDLPKGEKLTLSVNNKLPLNQAVPLLQNRNGPCFGIVGILWYDDVFGNAHKKRFCFVGREVDLYSEGFPNGTYGISFSSASGHNDET